MELAIPAKRIFVVDDQEVIQATTKSVLLDEGYTVETFGSAEDMITALGETVPDLVMLDIWLPGIDGMEALRTLQKLHPRLPIILMSGHAGIDVAVRALQAGASDFLEKPLNLDILLEKISKCLQGSEALADESEASLCIPDELLGVGELACYALSDEPQRTIARDAVMNGVGLLSGRPTGIIISPAPPDTGIVFRTLDGVSIPCHVKYLENYAKIGTEQASGFTANSTVLNHRGRRIRTVEHLLSALHMMGVSNAFIKVGEEIPNFDGSAVDFCRLIRDTGLRDQDQPSVEVAIKRKFTIGHEAKSEKHLLVEPFDGFEVSMRIDFPAPIHEQTYTFRPDRQSFLEDVAPARSFNTFANIDMAQKSGAVGSGYLNSHIIIHDGEVINTKLLFPDEFVRHKVLDLLGDLYLLGHRLRGRVHGNMSSHGLNQRLAKAIFQALPR